MKPVSCLMKTISSQVISLFNCDLYAINFHPNPPESSSKTDDCSVVVIKSVHAHSASSLIGDDFHPAFPHGVSCYQLNIHA